MKIFIDTGAFIALFVKSEINHKKVAVKYKEYKQKRALFLTSNYILDELYTRLMYDFGKNITYKVIQKLNKAKEEQQLRILNIDETVFNKSIEVFIKFGDHKISFTDATTYILIKDFQIDEIFTLDSDFKKIRAKTSF